MRQYELKEIIRILRRFNLKTNLGMLMKLDKYTKNKNEMNKTKISIMTLLQEAERIYF